MEKHCNSIITYNKNNFRFLEFIPENHLFEFNT